MDTIRIFGTHVLPANVTTIVLDKGVASSEVWEPTFFSVSRQSGRGSLHVKVSYSPVENINLEFPMQEFEVDQDYLRQEAHSVWGPGDRVKVAMTPSSDMTVNFVVMGKRYPFEAATKPVIPATGALTGKPGTWTPAGCTPPASVPALKLFTPTVVATPTTRWAAGEFVIVLDGNNAFWDGSTWQSGKAT